MKTNLMRARVWRLCVAALLLFVVNVAANAYDFSAKNGGVTIYYNITSEEELTVEVTLYANDYSSNKTAYSGDVSIPENVTNNGVTYTVTAIGGSAFWNCSGLTSVTIPNSVTEIGSYAFNECTGLTSVTIPNSVTSIEKYAFLNCTSLPAVTLSNSLTKIGDSAFSNCKCLAEVTIPESVTSIGLYAFRNCTSLTKIEVAEANEYYCSVDGVLFTKDMKKLIQFPLASYLLPSYEIPDGVKSIGSCAFYKCTGLTSVTIPNTVTEIGSSAFEACTGLTQVTIGEGVTEIGEYAFWDCTSLTEVTIPNSVTSIGSFAFDGCTGLTQITIGESVTKIYSSAFRNCTSLTKIEVAEDNEYYCSVDGVLFTKDMKELIRFPPASSLLPSYDIPESVTSIIGYAFVYCSGLTEVTIPNSVKTIGYMAFYQCTGLTEVAIPESVTEIGESAFDGCTGLASLTLGKSVTTIGKSAFYAYGGTGLTSITSLNPEPPTCSGSSVFYYGITGTCILSVPARSTSAYSTADTWKNFKNIVGIDVYSPTVQTLGETAVTGSTATLNGTVTAGEDEILEQGFEYWCADGEVVTVKCTGEEMSVTITGLESGATYTYRAYAKTESGTTYGSKVEFTTVIPTTVLVYEATDVTSESATLHGYVEAGSEEILECGFEYWGTNGVVNTVVVAEGDMSATLTGLTPNVTYGYRAYAKTESGTTRSENMGFSTIIPPTVQTYEATNVTESSALLSGYVEAGSEDVQVKGFEYWPEGGEIRASGMAPELPMEITFAGLDHGTKYTYRAYATTASGTTYGENVSFTTLTPTVTPPTVQTYAATEVTDISATLNGVITTGDEEILEHGFEYWSEGGEIQSITTRNQSMTVTLTELMPDTKYTYRAYAKTESGTTYGVEVTFTTLYDLASVYAELEEAIEEMNDDLKAAWKTITTDYPDAEDDCMDYYDAIFDKVMDLIDLLNSSYRKGNLYDDVVNEIWSGIAEGERMIEEMLAAAKELHATVIEGIIVKCGDDVQVYNLAGSRVHRIERGNVYIIRNADGTAKKVLVK